LSGLPALFSLLLLLQPPTLDYISGEVRRISNKPTDPKRDSKHLRHVTTAKRSFVFHQVWSAPQSVESETRWWAKDAALTKVFGKFGDPEGCIYIDLVVTLEALSEKDNI